MKKLVCVLAFCCLFSTSVMAYESSAQRWAVAVMAGGGFPKDDEIDATAFYGGRITYDVTENIAVGVESGWMGWEDEYGSQKYGDVSGIPLLANLIFKMPIQMGDVKVVPYAVGGAGVIFWKYKESDYLRSNNVSVDEDTALGLKAGLGTEIYFDEHFAVFLEGAYLWSDYNTNVRGNGAVLSADADTDMAQALGGIKYSF